MNFLEKIWGSIPDPMKAIAFHICMVGGYSLIFVFLQTYVENWQFSIALTAGVRAALIAIVQVLEAPKSMTTKAKKGKVVPEPVKLKLSQHL